jgi:hypothetical protein
VDKPICINNLIRIGVCYDGEFFLRVSNYYAYQQEIKRRISIK